MAKAKSNETVVDTVEETVENVVDTVEQAVDTVEETVVEEVKALSPILQMAIDQAKARLLRETAN